MSLARLLLPFVALTYHFRAAWWVRDVETCTSLRLDSLQGKAELDEDTRTVEMHQNRQIEQIALTLCIDDENLPFFVL